MSSRSGKRGSNFNRKRRLTKRGKQHARDKQRLYEDTYTSPPRVVKITKKKDT